MLRLKKCGGPLPSKWPRSSGPWALPPTWFPSGITVTDLTAFVPARVKDVAARTSFMKRFATSQDTAELVAFLASGSFEIINWSNILVTGGPTKSTV